MVRSISSFANYLNLNFEPQAPFGLGLAAPERSSLCWLQLAMYVHCTGHACASGVDFCGSV